MGNKKIIKAHGKGKHCHPTVSPSITDFRQPRAAMNPEEPSLLSHLNDVRKRALDEGGITTIIYCGQVRSEADLMDALQVHRAIVEEEVNNEKVNVTGILMGQVRVLMCFSFFYTFKRFLLPGQRHISCSRRPIIFRIKNSE